MRSPRPTGQACHVAIHTVTVAVELGDAGMHSVKRLAGQLTGSSTAQSPVLRRVMRDTAGDLRQSKARIADADPSVAPSAGQQASSLSHISWRTCVADLLADHKTAQPPHCGIEPYIDQAAPRSGAGPGVSAAAQPWEARAARAGPYPRSQINTAHT